MVAMKVTHIDENHTYATMTEMERRLAEQSAELTKQIEAKETEVVEANRKNEELSRLVGGLREEKSQAQLELNALRLRFEKAFTALENTCQVAASSEAQLSEERASRDSTIKALRADLVLFDNKVKVLKGDVRSVKSELKALKVTVESKKKAIEEVRHETEEYKKLAEVAFFDGIRCA